MLNQPVTDRCNFNYINIDGVKLCIYTKLSESDTCRANFIQTDRDCSSLMSVMFAHSEYPFLSVTIKL